MILPRRNHAVSLIRPSFEKVSLGFLDWPLATSDSRADHGIDHHSEDLLIRNTVFSSERSGGMRPLAPTPCIT